MFENCSVLQRRVHFTFLILSVFSASAFFAQRAQAASLYFIPPSGSYEMGAVLPVGIYVSSEDQAMNAASGVVKFPTDKFEVASLSKANSIFNLWVQEPSFSNTAGTVTFEGVVLNPGFIGARGKILTMNFKVKAAGAAVVSFSSGSVLANDGAGTNILTSLESAQFSLGGATPASPEATTEFDAVGAPVAPLITSATHPDPQKWYAVSDAEFSWKVPAGIFADRVLFGRLTTAIPTVTYVPPISSKRIEKLDDGIWYFHVRLKNNKGWGAVAHFRFQIDTVPPEPFAIELVDGKEADNPRPAIRLGAHDALSGIDSYHIRIGDADTLIVAAKDIPNGLFTLPLQTSGKKLIVVRAHDKAGNYATASEEFSITPLVAPILTEYPQKLQIGDPFTILGTTKYPSSTVTLWMQRGTEAAEAAGEVQSDGSGNFVFVSEQGIARGGDYTAWAEITDSRGAKSLPSNKAHIFVHPTAITKFGTGVITALAIIIPLIALILLLLWMLWYVWHKIASLREKLHKDVGKAGLAVHKAFDLLKEDIQRQVRLLERAKTKRELTNEEERIVLQLRKDLDDAEHIIEEKFEDIDEDLKK